MIPLAAEFKAFGNLGKFQNQYYPNFPGNRQQDPCRKVSVQDGGQNVNTDMKLNFKIEFHAVIAMYEISTVCHAVDHNSSAVIEYFHHLYETIKYCEPLLIIDR